MKIIERGVYMIDLVAFLAGALTAGVSIYVGYKMGYYSKTEKKADIVILPERKEEPAPLGGKVEEDAPDIW